MMHCILGLQTSLSMLIFPCICPDFLSFHTLNIIKFFVTDFCETVQAGVVIFCIQNDNDVFYCGIAKQPFHAYSSQHLSNFLSFHILIKRFFVKAFCDTAS